MSHDRKGHYIRPSQGSTRPTVVFSLVVDGTVETVPTNDTTILRRFRGGHLCVTRRRGNHWTKVRHFKCDSLDTLWGCLHALALPGYRNYVVCPSAAETLTLCDFWSRCERGGVLWEPTKTDRKKPGWKEPDPELTVFRRLVFGGNPDIVDYRHRCKRFVWVSGTQYIPGEEDDIARSLRWVWPQTGGASASGSFVLRQPEERARFWINVIQRLSEWWGTNSTAPWGMTCGQLGWGILRTHIKPKTVCTHAHADAHELEGDGKFGGRASVWFMGDVGVPEQHQRAACPAPPWSSYPPIPGPLYQVDVRSMYPWILREKPFPMKLSQWHPYPRAEQPQALTKSWGVLAACTIETNRGEYPQRHKGAVVYPTGRFSTVLTGPELDTLRKDGRVVKCHRMALYAMGRPFETAAGVLVEMRERARDRGDDAWELFAKLLANSLGGKLGQKRGYWMVNRKVTPQVRWGQWLEAGATNGSIRKYRALAGLVWQWVASPPGDGPFVASYNYLTAYGRVLIRQIRDACPPDSVISQDTDGLWVTREGRDALMSSRWEFGDRAGQLRIAQVEPAARFYGPRHYWVPSGWTLSGFAHPTVASNGVDVTYSENLNPIRGHTTSAPDWTSTVTRRATLKLEVEGGCVDGLGWVHAPHRRGPRITSSKGG